MQGSLGCFFGSEKSQELLFSLLRVEAWWQMISFWKVNNLDDPEVGPAQRASTGQSTCPVQGGFAVDQHGSNEQGWRQIRKQQADTGSLLWQQEEALRSSPGSSSWLKARGQDQQQQSYLLWDVGDIRQRRDSCRSKTKHKWRVVKSRQHPRDVRVLARCGWHEHVPMASTEDRSKTKSRGNLPTLQGRIWQKSRNKFPAARSSSVEPGKRLRNQHLGSAVPTSAIASGNTLISRERMGICGNSVARAKPHRSARATVPGIMDTPRIKLCTHQLWLW